jgi:hypothetical protein
MSTGNRLSKCGASARAFCTAKRSSPNTAPH